MMTEDNIQKVQSEASTTECDSCGGDMKYDPESKQLKCQFCGSVKAIDVTRAQVAELKIGEMNQRDFDWSIEPRVIVCENCGGQTITEPNDETSYCDYCGSQHIVIRKEENLGMKPQGLVPFDVTMDKAKTMMGTWVKRQWLAPNDLKERFLGKDLKGVFMPYWTFDAHLYAHYDVQIGTYYYTGSGKERKRHTRWRHHSGAHNKAYDDVLVTAVTFKEPGLLKKIEPFHTTGNQVVDYKPDYLAGYRARKYTIMPETAYGEARSFMESDIASDIKRGLHGDTYRHYRQSCSHTDQHFKHILLPVYMTAYEYKNKIYNVLINGQTGEVQGKAPLSPIKVAGLVLLGIALAGVIYYISNS